MIHLMVPNGETGHVGYAEKAAVDEFDDEAPVAAKAVAAHDPKPVDAYSLTFWRTQVARSSDYGYNSILGSCGG